MSYIANYQPKPRQSTYDRWLAALARNDHAEADRLISPKRPDHWGDCGCPACLDYSAAYGTERSYASALY